ELGGCALCCATAAGKTANIAAIIRGRILKFMIAAPWLEPPPFYTDRDPPTIQCTGPRQAPSDRTPIPAVRTPQKMLSIVRFRREDDALDVGAAHDRQMALRLGAFQRQEPMQIIDAQ